MNTEETLNNIEIILSRMQSEPQLSKALQRNLMIVAEDFYLDHFVAEMKESISASKHESALAYQSRLSQLSTNLLNQS